MAAVLMYKGISIGETPQSQTLDIQKIYEQNLFASLLQNLLQKLH